MITFERTQDTDLIKSIVTTPKIYQWLSDDGSPDREDYEPIMHESLWYVLAHKDEKLLGLFFLQPHNSICWEIHTCLLPDSWGATATEAGMLVIRWVWENTQCVRIVTNVPSYNRLAHAFALRCGLKEFGTNDCSYLKGGHYYSQVMLGVTKAGLKCL